MNAQSTFETIYSDPDGKITQARFIGETSDGGFIMLCTSYLSGNYNFNGKIIKLSSNGEVIDNFDFDMPGMVYNFVELFHHPVENDMFIAVGVMRNINQDNHQSVVLLYIDKDLELVDVKEISFASDINNLVPADIPHVLVDNYDNIIFSTHAYSNDYHFCYLFARITADGDLVNYRINNEINGNVDINCDVFTFGDEPLQYGLIIAKLSEPEMDVYLVDSTFNCQFVKRLDGELINHDNYYNRLSISPSCRAIQLDSSEYLVTTRCSNMDYYTYDGDLGVILLKMNQQFEIIEHDDIGSLNDTTETIGSINPIAAKDNYIYHLSNSNEHDIYQTDPTYITISKYDMDLNLVWRRYHGGDRIYIPASIVATEDNGCFIAGYCYNLKDYNNMLYALKLNEDSYLSSPEYQDVIKPYLIYPNPCKDFINIEISPDITIEEAELYDLSWRLVMSQDSGFESIDVTNLGSGVYVLKMKTTNGKEYSEKVVLE